MKGVWIHRSFWKALRRDLLADQARVTERMEEHNAFERLQVVCNNRRSTKDDLQEALAEALIFWQRSLERQNRHLSIEEDET